MSIPLPAAQGFPVLPLLNYVERLFGAQREQPLAEYSVLCVQHLLASTGSLIESLVRCGADLRTMHIAGKAYSTNTAVLDSLREAGIPTASPFFGDSIAEPYDEVLTRTVATLTEVAQAQISNRLTQGLLLIDDGGHALVQAHKLAQAGLPVRAVEQTTRGIRVARTLPPQMCIVNIGRSQAKLELETPLIAESMVRGLKRLMAATRDVFGSTREVFQIGYGSVGREVAHRLNEENYRVTVFDRAAEIRLAAAAAGFSVAETLRDAPRRQCVVTASTGGISFPPSAHGVLAPGSLLVSMGSSDVEFAAWELRAGERVRAVYDEDGRRLRADDNKEPWNRHYAVTVANHHVYLSKGGFPVDFDGGPDPIPAGAIQLTRALLLAGILQASKETRLGLVDLDAEVQRLIMQEYARLTASDS